MFSITKKIALFLLISLLSACSGSPAPVENKPADELDAAIRETSNYLNNQLPAGNKLVILNVQSGYPALSEYIIDELIANTVNDRFFSVVDRHQLDMIRAELDFQMSGEVDDNTAQALGRMAGAQIIVSGAISRVGDLYRLRIRALNVQTASIAGQFNKNIPGGVTITALTGSQATGYGSSGGTNTPQRTSAAQTGAAPATQTAAAPAAQPTQTPTVQAAASQPAPAPAASAISIEVTARSGGTLFFQDREIAKLWDNDTHTIPIEAPGTYTLRMVMADHTDTRSVVINARGVTKVSFGGVFTVGQPGPAGGIVFFDKGSYSDGWRYLEAASADIAGTAEWGAFERDVGRTTTGRGSGRRNTQIIADYLKETGETGRAAQVTQEFRQGGYADWFLPSKDELNLLYVNLKQRGLGRFQNGMYWSSSESDRYIAWVQNFGDGGQWNDSDGYKSRPRYVRAIRQF